MGHAQLHIACVLSPEKERQTGEQHTMANKTGVAHRELRFLGAGAGAGAAAGTVPEPFLEEERDLSRVSGDYIGTH